MKTPGPTVLERVEEELRALQTFLRVYHQYGGDGDEVQLMRTAMLPRGKAQPLLTVRRKAETVEAEAEPKRKRKRRSTSGGRNTVLALFAETGRAMSSAEMIRRWPEPLPKGNQPVYQALYELRKAGLLRRNDVDGLYSLVVKPGARKTEPVGASEAGG